ncbi:uncharacterized protein K02A2.6-like [Armigeres subalbatus]|uniref:uncharacterized protein K02A2.6-like n=1 Tax=Armigeres subalbatus TaxID=124917 RepID=UPI002ED1E313
MIVDQITEKCNSDALRIEILKRDKRSLGEIVALGTTMADTKAKSQQMAREIVSKEGSQVNWVGNKIMTNRQKRPVMKRGVVMSCFACGHEGHLKASKVCPAKDVRCNKCNAVGHFARCCFKQGWKLNQGNNRLPSFGKRKFESNDEAGPSKRIRSVRDEAVEDEQQQKSEGYIFYAMGRNEFHFKVGGVIIPMTIDSGADANIISADSWKQMKEAGVKVLSMSKQSDRVLRAYASKDVLPVVGMFQAEVAAGQNQTTATFYVVTGDKQCLLGESTARELQVLKIGFDIAAIKTPRTTFPKIKGVVAEISIDETVQPVQQPYRRAPFALEELIEKKLTYLLEQDIIERVNQPSRWVSPLVPVMKDSGDVRLCVDMRRANRAVIQEKHPLPVIDDLLGSINGAVRFSKLDVKDAYHQVELSERSREITTFITKYGLFRYKRLMFGICSAPELFQKIMESIVAGLEGVIVYLDDVMVFGSTEKEHDLRLAALLQRLKEFNLQLNTQKCQINVTSLEFLGHQLSEEGIRPTESRVQAIKQFRPPTTVAELRSFLGLVTYVGRFIPNLASKTDPLRCLLRTGATFKWSQIHQVAFDSIKAEIESTRFLGFFNPKDTTILIADASPTGLGAVLLQENTAKEKRIIAFASKALTDLERKYFQTEREALALVWAVEKFRLYLLGTTFRLITDCKPLDFLFSYRSKPCPRIERWVLRIQSFRFQVVYEPGATNLADALSRLSMDHPVSFDGEEEGYIRCLVAAAIPNAITVKEVEEESIKDSSINDLINALDGGQWSDSVKAFKPFESELYRSGNLVLRESRLVIPMALRKRILQLAHESHPGIGTMKRRLRQKVWWPGIDKDVERMIKSCKSCVIVSSLEPHEPLKRTLMPESAWVDLAADFVGPLPSGHNLLVIVDYFSRFIEVIVMKQITAALTVKAFHETFCRFGMPETLKTDNGPQFISEELGKFCKQFGIELRKTTPYWPQANGEVERVNGMLAKHLKISQAEDTDWIYACVYLCTIRLPIQQQE